MFRAGACVLGEVCRKVADAVPNRHQRGRLHGTDHNRQGCPA
jgi:hypothetical protein